MAPFLLSIRKCLTTSGYVPYTDFQLKQYMCTFRKRDQGMGRLVLYVPENRQAQVDEWREKLNYSRLFFESFDRAVALQKEIEKMGKTGIDPVVKRLKEDSLRAEAEAKAEGVKAGTTWAREYASKRDLNKLAGTYANFQPQSAEDLNFEGLWLILTEDYDQFIEHQNYGESRSGSPTGWDEDEQYAWAVGFLDGAEETWNQVSDKL